MEVGSPSYQALLGRMWTMAMTYCARDDDVHLKLLRLELNDSTEQPTSILLLVLSTMMPENKFKIHSINISYATQHNHLKTDLY